LSIFYYTFFFISHLLLRVFIFVLLLFSVHQVSIFPSNMWHIVVTEIRTYSSSNAEIYTSAHCVTETRGFRNGDLVTFEYSRHCVVHKQRQGTEELDLECHVRAVAQVVSSWLPSAAARVRSRVRSCGICGEQSGTGVMFSTSTSVSPAKHSTDCSTLIIIHHHQVLVHGWG
jgi:hypothetical protein